MAARKPQQKYAMDKQIDMSLETDDSAVTPRDIKLLIMEKKVEGDIEEEKKEEDGVD